MSREELERIDDLGMKAWEEHDPNAFVSLFADDFTWQDSTLPEPITTREDAASYMQSWFTAFPDMRVTTVNRVVGEDGLATEVSFTGTNTGPLAMGGAELAPTGRSVTNQGAYFAKVRDGKITEFSSHPDVAGLMTQLGMVPESTSESSAS